jgi:hypothetical protein
VGVDASPWPSDTLVYVGDGQMEPLAGPPAPAQRCLATVTPDEASDLLDRSPDATGRPVVVLDSSGIVAGAQAARFVLMTDTVDEALLRRVDGDEGWALSTAEVQHAFECDTNPQGPDMPAVVMDAAGQVIHGADVLSEVRRPTPIVILVE